MKRVSLILTVLTCVVSATALPVSFVQHQPGKFSARFGAAMAEINADGIAIDGIKLRFRGAAASARLQPIGQPSAFSYIRANKISSVPAYARIQVRGLYPGIDCLFYGSGGNIEYDLLVHAGARPEEVLIAVEGAGRTRIAEDGSVSIDTESATLQLRPPRVSQGEREIPAAYVLREPGLIAIRAGSYNHRADLLIDPVLVYSKKVGGSKMDFAQAIATDSAGNIYVAGMTNSADFPVTSGAIKPRLAAPLKVISDSGSAETALAVGTAVQAGIVSGTADGRVLYVSTTDGIYSSTDAGASWRPTAPLPIPSARVAPGLDPVTSIAVDQQDPATILVGTFSGMFGSSDGGRNWGLRNAGLTVSASEFVAVTWVTYDPNNPLVAYATTSNPFYLFRSTDAGGSWSLLNPADPDNSASPASSPGPLAAVLSGNGDQLFVATTNGSLLTSSDQGATWVRAGQGPFRNPTRILLDPVHAGTIYVLDQSDLWRSTDGGQTFASRVTAGSVRQAAVDASGTLYLASFQQLYVSKDTGTTFSPLRDPRFAIQALSSVGGKVYLGETVPVMPFVMKLDPTGSTILYATFFGGGSGDFLTSLAVDTKGQAVIGGSTVSPDFPVTVPGATITLGPGHSSGFIAKLSADGTRLVYSKLIGGSKSTSVQGLAVDAEGNAFVAGATGSTDLPTTESAAQRTVPSTCSRVSNTPFVIANTGIYGFVAEVSADGQSSLYSTYLTGACGSTAQTVTVGSGGDAFVAGYTTSFDMPFPAGGYQPSFPGSPEQMTPPATLAAGFVARISPAGDKVLAASYLGGGFTTRANSIALDTAGNPTIVGASQGFAPAATAGAYQPALLDRCVRPISIGPSGPYTGTGDAFVLKLDPSLSSARFLTYLGGSCDDSAQAIAFDAAGNIWVGGTSLSPDFPLADPFQANAIPGASGFVSELSADASRLLFSSLSSAVNIAIGSSRVYQAGQENGSAVLTAIDPGGSPAVHVHAIVAKTGYPPDQLAPLAAGISPGQLIEIRGENLGPAEKVQGELDTVGRLPFVLRNVRVLFGNVPAALISVQAESIVCFAPFEITAISEVQVRVNESVSNVVRIGVRETAPQILSITNADGSLNGPDHPAKLGSAISILVSGLGETDPPSADGLLNATPLPVPVAPVSVYLSGNSVTPSFAGAAAGMVAGIFRINVTLPVSPPPGVSGDKLTLGVQAAMAPVYFTR